MEEVDVFTDHIRKLKPRVETYIPVVEKVHSIISGQNFR